MHFLREVKERALKFHQKKKLNTRQIGYQPSLRQTVPLPSVWVFAERYLSGAWQRPPLPSAGLSAKNALSNDSFA
jgi:hypothetical protein